MNKRVLAVIFPAVFGGLLVAQQQGSSGSPMSFRAGLTGFQEVPAVFTKGSGEFRASVSPDRTRMNFELEYRNLSSTVSMAHIHFGQRGVNGAVMVWLCGGGGRPPCPNPPDGVGRVSGTIEAAHVVGIPAQGILAGNFDQLLEAVRRGVTYVNVHTTNFGGGEVRGQIRPGRGDRDDDDDKGPGKAKGKSGLFF